MHGNLNHLPPTVLNNLSFPWPFVAWVIDIIGEIKPIALNRHKYIVVAINYFSRRVEAKSFSILKVRQMARLIKKSFICRHGVPNHIVIDNWVQF